MKKVDLPVGWSLIKVRDIFYFIGGGTPNKSHLEYWVPEVPWASVKDIKSKFLNKTQDFISELSIEKSATNVAIPNELILVTRINPGRATITKIKTAINQDLKIVKPRLQLSPNFQFYLFNYLERSILENSSGTTVLGISLNNLNDLEFPLPPLAEQHRIVAEIEELFSELDKGIEALKTAQEQLKVYRQSVLKYAFEGRLTNPDVKEGELPEEWMKSKLGSIFKTTSGGTPSRRVREFYGGDIPWVKSGELVNHTVFSTEEHITSEAIKQSSAKVFPAGTLMIALYGATIGKLAFLGINAATNQAVCGIFPSRELVLDYLYHFLIFNKQKLIDSAIGGAQPNISQAILRGLDIYYPIKLDLQKKVVQEIESRLSVCDKIEENIKESLQHAEALRQSILKSAFEGKLVPQDPNDEPASVLLERIKAERAATKAMKKTRKLKEKA